MESEKLKIYFYLLKTKRILNSFYERTYVRIVTLLHFLIIPNHINHVKLDHSDGIIKLVLFDGRNFIRYMFYYNLIKIITN